jgi:hypothetical protein
VSGDDFMETISVEELYFDDSGTVTVKALPVTVEKSFKRSGVVVLR